MSTLSYSESIMVARSPEDGVTRFHNRFGSDAPDQIADRTLAARNGIPVTLAALKKSAESG